MHRFKRKKACSTIHFIHKSTEKIGHNVCKVSLANSVITAAITRNYAVIT